MPRDHDVLRALIREVLGKLSADDVALSKQRMTPNAVDPHGMGRMVRVVLNGRSWLTASQAEVDRVIKAGGHVMMRNGEPVRK